MAEGDCKGGPAHFLDVGFDGSVPNKKTIVHKAPGNHAFTFAYTHKHTKTHKHTHTCTCSLMHPYKRSGTCTPTHTDTRLFASSHRLHIFEVLGVILPLPHNVHKP